MAVLEGGAVSYERGTQVLEGIPPSTQGFGFRGSHSSLVVFCSTTSVRAIWDLPIKPHFLRRGTTTHCRACSVIERPLPPARLRLIHSVCPNGIECGSTGNVVGCLP